MILGSMAATVWLIVAIMSTLRGLAHFSVQNKKLGYAWTILAIDQLGFSIRFLVFPV
jgi:hypothetical protein